MTGRRLGISSDMEAEIFGLCGTMLGMLELIADEDAGADAQRRERLASAVRCGTALRDRIEAVVLLARDDLERELKTTPHSIRKLIAHAAHAPSTSLGDHGVRVQLPVGEHWGAQVCVIDVSRMDRMLSCMTEQLGASLGPQGRIGIAVNDVPAGVQVHFSGHAGTGALPLTLSPLLQRAWQRLVELHGGTLEVDREARSIMLTLPLAVTSEAKGSAV